MSSLNMLLDSVPEASWPFALSALCLYLVTVRILRYRRRDGLLKKYNYPTRESLGRMTVDDAFEIQLQLLNLEFPTIYSTAGFFALFKTYGIPSISRLLLETGQLVSPSTMTKRAADTGVIINEFISLPPSSPRTIDSIARMNYLHNAYRRAGKISDADMLYTLSLFALEGVRWIDRYEWRALTQLEICAMGVFWKDLGDAMEIPYTLLLEKKEKKAADGNADTRPEGTVGSKQSPWRDALEWLDDLEEWSLAYEAEHMVPAQSNAALAVGGLKLALRKVPRSLHTRVMHVISIMLGERLRTAMLFDAPPASYITFFTAVVAIRKFVIRHLCLPRSWRNRKVRSPEHPDPKTGRFYKLSYRIHPWYMKPTVKHRWGPKALLTRLRGGILPGDDGSKYMPQGYLTSELGPSAFAGKGGMEMEGTRVKLKSMRAAPGAGCPFAGGAFAPSET